MGWRYPKSGEAFVPEPTGQVVGVPGPMPCYDCQTETPRDEMLLDCDERLCKPCWDAKYVRSQLPVDLGITEVDAAKVFAVFAERARILSRLRIVKESLGAASNAKAALEMVESCITHAGVTVKEALDRASRSMAAFQGSVCDADLPQLVLSHGTQLEFTDGPQPDVEVIP